LNGLEDRLIEGELALQGVALGQQGLAPAWRGGLETLVESVEFRFQVVDLRGEARGHLREILLLRSGFDRLRGVGGVLFHPAEGGSFGTRGLKCKLNDLGSKALRIVLIESVTWEAGRLHFGSGVAIPGNNLVQVAEGNVRVE
jgi:hypothetical protein